MDSVLFALWFFLPAGAANAAPIIASRMPFVRRFDQPMDFGAYYHGKPVFGAHKTLRGLVSGIITAIVVVYIQQVIYQHYEMVFLESPTASYLEYSPLVLGFLFGFGALIGDAIESFFKRRSGIAPGTTWFPYDQIDYIIGGCVALAVLVRLSAFEYVSIIVIWFVMHIVFSFVGYKLKLKPHPI